jgi:hypothetical protein
MKNRTSYIRRNFRGNIETECIGNSALTGKAEYRVSQAPVKEIAGADCYT